MGFIFDVIVSVLIVYLVITVSNIKRQLSSGIKPAPAQEEEKAPKQTVSVTDKQTVNPPAGKDPVEEFFKWFARDWPLKVGSIFILLGVGWFLTYAFINNLIGPLGRLILGISSGAVVMVLGNFRIKKNIYQGEVLAALGAGILLTTVFASEHIYANLIRSLYPQWVSLILVTFVIAALTFTSYINKTIRLAALAFLVGAFAPLIVGTPGTDIVTIFGYLLALVLGLIWLVRLTGWRVLIILPLTAIIFYTLIYKTAFALSPDQRLLIEFFSAAFTTIFYLSSLAAFAYDKSRDQKDMAVGILFSLYSFIWVTAFVTSINKSIVFAIFALVFMTGALILSKMKSIDDAVYMYFIVSIVFLVIATFIQIKDPALLPIAVITEAILLLVFCDRIYSKRAALFSSILFIPAVLLSLKLFTAYYIGSRSYNNYYYDPIPVMLFGFLTNPVKGLYDAHLIFINIVLYASAFYAYLYNKHKELVTLGKLLLVAAALFTLYYMWVAIPFYLNLMQSVVDGRMFVLVIYAIIGLALYFFGISAVKLWTKRFGFLLTCFVIIRLLLFEIWSMSITAKIVTFIAVGTIFILSVFVQLSMTKKSNA